CLQTSDDLRLRSLCRCRCLPLSGWLHTNWLKGRMSRSHRERPRDEERFPSSLRSLSLVPVWPHRQPSESFTSSSFEHARSCSSPLSVLLLSYLTAAAFIFHHVCNNFSNWLASDASQKCIAA